MTDAAWIHVRRHGTIRNSMHSHGRNARNTMRQALFDVWAKRPVDWKSTCRRHFELSLQCSCAALVLPKLANRSSTECWKAKTTWQEQVISETIGEVEKGNLKNVYGRLRMLLGRNKRNSVETCRLEDPQGGLVTSVSERATAWQNIFLEEFWGCGSKVDHVALEDLH